ncbi:MAG: beta-ketoacyl synthase chain length factor [Salinivirgaceae bacterium]|nr:beta-ketoacyl synthase chain length factor [Salinivirgaceae bacterium]
MKPITITKSCQLKADILTVNGCEEPFDFKELVADASLRRRMSRIVKMGVACGLKCAEELPSDSIDGIVTATGLGCLGDTEKFMESIVVNNERLLNPTPFIQSTFNTIGGQIALLRGIHSYNVTYVHRGLSFESALIDAAMQVADGKRNVLLGAVDEITASSADIQRRLGMTREYELGEGANFFVLNTATPDSHQTAILDIDTRSGKLTDSELTEWIVEMARRNGINANDLCIVANCNTDTADSVANCLSLKIKPLPFKTCEYHTLSAQALDFAINNSTANNTLIISDYQGINHSLILLGKI